MSREAFEIFHSAGAVVGKFEGYGIVKLPHYLVEDCIRWASRNVIYYGRDSEKDYILEPHRVGFSTFGECIRIIDPSTKKIRKSLKRDLAGAILCPQEPLKKCKTLLKSMK